MEIYVHIPFCIKKCLYCDFVSFSFGEEQKDIYLNSLLEEIRDKKALLKEQITSIYFGGGTPTSFGIKRLESVLNELTSEINLSATCEITIEGNPKTFDKKMLMALKDMGFNRFSVGVQSFNDSELKGVGRIHSSEQAINALADINEVFDNFSLDLMIGLRTQTKQTFLHSLQMAVDAKPKHISCYMLKVEEGTKLYKMEQAGEFKQMDEDEQADLYDLMTDFLADYGYERYETSNFAKTGFESKHNLGYWNLTEYIGFGISAHSLCGNERRYNTSSFEKYISNPTADNIEELLTKEDMEKEYIMLSLRLKEGINLKAFKAKFNVDFSQKYKNSIESAKNYINVTNKNISIKQVYTSVASSIIIMFI